MLDFIVYKGAVPGAMLIETIMEHVAFELNKHPILVKEINLYEKGQVRQGIEESLKKNILKSLRSSVVISLKQSILFAHELLPSCNSTSRVNFLKK